MKKIYSILFVIFWIISIALILWWVYLNSATSQTLQQLIKIKTQGAYYGQY